MGIPCDLRRRGANGRVWHVGGGRGIQYVRLGVSRRLK